MVDDSGAIRVSPEYQHTVGYDEDQYDDEYYDDLEVRFQILYNKSQIIIVSGLSRLNGKKSNLKLNAIMTMFLTQNPRISLYLLLEVQT